MMQPRDWKRLHALLNKADDEAWPGGAFDKLHGEGAAKAIHAACAATCRIAWPDGDCRPSEDDGEA